MLQKYRNYRNLILIFILLFSGCKANDKVEMKLFPESSEIDMSDYLGIEDEHCFRQVTLMEMDRMFKEGGSGIFYMGYVDCSYCQSLLQYLNRAGLDSGVTIYYIDGWDKEYPLYEEEYEKIYIEDLYEVLREDDGVKTLYTPHVFTLVNGEIKSSLIAAKDWSVQDPTTSQKKKLINTYKEMFEPFIE